MFFHIKKLLLRMFCVHRNLWNVKLSYSADIKIGRVLSSTGYDSWEITHSQHWGMIISPFHRLLSCPESPTPQCLFIRAHTKEQPSFSFHETSCLSTAGKLRPKRNVIFTVMSSESLVEGLAVSWSDLTHNVFHLLFHPHSKNERLLPLSKE